MWTPLDPDNFSRFEPTDILAFLDWFEREYANAMALGFADAFVEGLMVPYLEAIASGVTVPWWIDTMLRYRMAAQWSYQVGEPLSRGLQRNLAAIIPDDRLLEYADRFKITPTDIANIPPAIRNAFLENRGTQLYTLIGPADSGGRRQEHSLTDRVSHFSKTAAPLRSISAPSSPSIRR